jgi:hypothetical protein
MAMVLRYLRAVLVGLLLLQSGLLAPAAMALDAGQSMADCSENMGASDDDCPCCPQGILSLGGCVAFCLGVLASMASPADMMADASPMVRPGIPPTLHDSQAYSPVNPPPIG